MNRQRKLAIHPAALCPVILALVALGLGCAHHGQPVSFPPTAAPGSTGAATVARLTILHSNDTHGHLLPFSYPEGGAGNPTLAALPERSDIGGIARRATMVKQVKAECAKDGSVVRLIDAGDFCDGTPFSTENHGEADIAAMNACGYDYGTFGNHEYNQPLAQVRKLRGMAKESVLCANMVWKSTGKPLLNPFALDRIGPLTVGFFGLTTEEAGTYPGARDSLLVRPPIETAKAMVDTLRRLGADAIILVSHCGNDIDDALAAQVPDICAIVGGHSHSRLPSGQYFAQLPSGKTDSLRTMVVQAHQWGGELGRLDLEFRQGAFGKWTMVGHRERLLPITKAVTPDPAVAAVVDRFWAPIAEKYGRIIGTATDDFSSRGPDRAEYNLMADAIRETFGTDIEMENMGGVRAPLMKGEIKLDNLVNLDPFSNTVVTYKITGSQIRSILLNHKPAVSGIRYHIANGVLAEATVNGQPLEDGREYTGTSNSYFAGQTLKSAGITWVDTGEPRLDVLVKYIETKKEITPSYDGRRVVGRDGQ
jgi:2',3'-cyclic-nucleotide 2'-phosphodiesterase (5'-nucleotidase family)